MVNYMICNCKQVSRFDVEEALEKCHKFEDVEKRFHEMGFDRAFPPGTSPETTIQALRELLHLEGVAV